MSSINESSENTSIYTEVSQDEKDYELKLNKKENDKKPRIDIFKQRYPYCIVWTPIPCISWLLSSIGHAGICNSKGVIFDFAGPYFVSVDDMAFGNPTKCAILQLTQKQFYEYDRALELGRKSYNKMDYNFFTNNCHSFIANVLNNLKYKGRDNYNMVDVWWMFFTKSKYLTWIDFLRTYFGFFVILFLILFIYFILKF